MYLARGVVVCAGSGVKKKEDEKFNSVFTPKQISWYKCNKKTVIKKGFFAHCSFMVAAVYKRRRIPHQLLCPGFGRAWKRLREAVSICSERERRGRKDVACVQQ